MKLLLGTRVYTDFPTTSAIIYPKEVMERALADNALREAIRDRKLVGGIFDGPHVTPKDSLITHYVTDIRIYNEEIVVELETIETDEVNEALAAIGRKKAAIVMQVPAAQGGVGSIVRKILSIECVHIKEDHNA